MLYSFGDITRDPAILLVATVEVIYIDGKYDNN